MSRKDINIRSEFVKIFNKIKKQRKVGIDTLIRVSLNEIIVKARSASRDPNKFQTYIKSCQDLDLKLVRKKVLGE